MVRCNCLVGNLKFGSMESNTLLGAMRCVQTKADCHLWFQELWEECKETALERKHHHAGFNSKLLKIRDKKIRDKTSTPGNAFSSSPCPHLYMFGVVRFLKHI